MCGYTAGWARWSSPIPVSDAIMGKSVDMPQEPMTHFEVPADAPTIVLFAKADSPFRGVG